MPELLTERLRLRMWSASDGDPWAALCSDPNFWRFPYGRGLRAAEAAETLARITGHWEQHGFGLWAAEDRASCALMGFIGLAVPAFLPEVLPAVEIAWRLGTDWWGRGLATEGARAALAYGFGELGLDRVISIAQPENTASLRVMEKLGMTPERTTMHPALGVDLVVTEIRNPAPGG